MHATSPAQVGDGKEDDKDEQNRTEQNRKTDTWSLVEIQKLSMHVRLSTSLHVPNRKPSAQVWSALSFRWLFLQLHSPLYGYTERTTHHAECSVKTHGIRYPHGNK